MIVWIDEAGKFFLSEDGVTRVNSTWDFSRVAKRDRRRARMARKRRRGWA